MISLENGMNDGILEKERTLQILHGMGWFTRRTKASQRSTETLAFTCLYEISGRLYTVPMGDLGDWRAHPSE